MIFRVLFSCHHPDLSILLLQCPNKRNIFPHLCQVQKWTKTNAAISDPRLSGCPLSAYCAGRPFCIAPRREPPAFGQKHIALHCKRGFWPPGVRRLLPSPALSVRVCLRPRRQSLLSEPISNLGTTRGKGAFHGTIHY